jgi:hypothetical protein
MFERAATLGLPAADVVEVTVIGPGFGESVVLHVGGGEWMIVDSCTRGHDVLPLRYLEELGVDSTVAVKRLVATHWDLDHVQGLGRVAERCASAKLVIPRSLEPQLVTRYITTDSQEDGDWEEVAREHGIARTRFRRSTLEFLQAFRALERSYAGPLTTVRNRIGHAGMPDVHVQALSPSDAVFEDHMQQIARLTWSTESGTTMPEHEIRRRLENRLQRNGCSVALWVRIGDRRLLPGADLESSTDPRRGWRAVANLEDRDTDAAAKASVLKVPHHGSQNARDRHLWEALVETDATAVVAPWYRGGRWLPTNADIEALRQLAEVMWCCCLPPASGYSPPHVLEGQRPVGYVTLRAPASGPPSWDIVAASTAREFRRRPSSS